MTSGGAIWFQAARYDATNLYLVSSSGAGDVTGIGVVEGVEVMINANDPTVGGGTTNPFTLRKLGRAHDIAACTSRPR